MDGNTAVLVRQSAGIVRVYVRKEQNAKSTCVGIVTSAQSVITRWTARVVLAQSRLKKQNKLSSTADSRELMYDCNKLR